MREPFIATSLAMTLFGYAALRQRRSRSALAALAGGIVLGLLVSPPFGLLIAGVAALFLLVETKVPSAVRWSIVAVLCLVAILAIGLTVRSWSTLREAPQDGPLDMLGWWMASGARFQTYRLERASGWVQEMLRDRIPEWSHPFLVTFYGTVQPLLPAALTDNTSVPMIRGVAIWRALGWFLMLIPLIYGLGAVVRTPSGRSDAVRPPCWPSSSLPPPC